jgi:hypothetical protein
MTVKELILIIAFVDYSIQENQEGSWTCILRTWTYRYVMKGVFKEIIVERAIISLFILDLIHQFILIFNLIHQFILIFSSLHILNIIIFIHISHILSYSFISLMFSHIHSYLSYSFLYRKAL